jgi:hypothetical protein
VGVAVTNRSRTLASPANLQSTCNHTTVLNTVSSESSTCFALSQASADADGDPLTVEVTLSGSGYSYDGTPPTAPAANGLVSFSCGLQTTYTPSWPPSRISSSG